MMLKKSYQYCLFIALILQSYSSFSQCSITVNAGADQTVCAGTNVTLTGSQGTTNDHSMTFDGNGDFVQVPYDNSFNVSDLTIESWVYTGDLYGAQGIFEKGDINTQYVFFFGAAQLKFRTYHLTGSNTMSVSPASIGLTPNNWYHLAATYDGANKKIYVDGTLQATYACTGAITNSTVGSVIGAIGGGTFHGNYYWDGKLDEVRVWNVARTANEIVSNYQSNIPPTSPGLIGYWNFEEGSGTTTENLVDNQSATLNGDAVFNTTPCPVNSSPSLSTTYTWDNGVNNGVAFVPTISSQPNLSIGDFYQGGIIAYILQAGDPGYVSGYLSGLIATPSDQTTSTQWGCQGTNITGAGGTALGTGAQNTIDIEAGCSTFGTAADICENLILGGYSDWFLPSQDELVQMSQNRAIIDSTATANGGSNFTTDIYWSSSQYNADIAYVAVFSSGLPSLSYKNNPKGVRAVRTFTQVVVPATNTKTYTVTGTDANGCTGTNQVVVTVDSLPTVDAGADQTVCAGTNVTLTGSGAASYAWDNGVTNATAFAANATATYTVTGTDANSCAATDAVVITVNALPTVDAGADQTVCAGTNVTLTGSGAASYAWDNGVTNATAFAANATATYTVTGTDANNCTATDAVVITVNALPTVDAGADQTVCAGTNVTLTGSGAASYAWDNGVTNATAFAANATATYTVTGTDANNCTATDAVVITVNPLPMVDAGADQTVCAGTNVTLTLSGAYYYDWDNGVINGTAFAANTTTTYTVTATDATTCTATDQVVITVNPLPMVDAGADQTVCAGTNVTLTGSGASTFTWDNSVADGTAFSPTSTATYTVTGTDANGCIGTDNIDVTVNTLPTVSAGADQAVCDGGAVTLSGSGASIYAWDNGVNDGASFTPTATATYTVTGTDANGCIGTDNVDVTVNALPTVSAGADQAVCNGGAVTLSGSGAIASVWDNGITDGASFTPTATATYTLTGTDINNCTGTDQVDVTVNAKYYNISTISLCTGDSVLAGGAYQLASGTFYDSLSSMAGCDSVIETVLTVSSQITVNIPLSICLGDSALINGNYELASGTFSANAVSVAWL